MGRVSCIYGTCWGLDRVWWCFGKAREARETAGVWFCNVLELCTGSFLEGRERLSIQGFHLHIASMDCLPSPSQLCWD